jgi:hypothetical protein
MDELPFRIVREVAGERDEVLALAINLKVARAAYHAAAREYPDDVSSAEAGRPGDRTEQTLVAAVEPVAAITGIRKRHAP